MILNSAECTVAARHGYESQRKREKGTSCAECQRRKLKCNRKIPCNNCQDKSRSKLCPNGRFQTSHGARFVLAATEPLQRRVVLLRNRITELEELLASLLSASSKPCHLLCEKSWVDEEDKSDFSGEKSTLNDKHRDHLVRKVSEFNNTFSTLLISNRGVTQYFGVTGQMECLLRVLPSVKSLDSLDKALIYNHDDGFHFSRIFPFVFNGPNVNVLRLLEYYFPPYERAKELCIIYLERAGWNFYTLTKRQLFEEMLPTLYFHDSLPTIEQSALAVVDSYSNPHDIALFFIALGIGSLLVPDLPMAEHFRELSRVALMLHPVLENPTVSTIQTILLMSVYKGIMVSSGGSSKELIWSLRMMAVHLSQSMGLHRDCSQWGMSQNNMERRRTVLWDLFRIDTYESMFNGRPPGFCKRYIDCHYPRYWDTSSASHYLQFRFSAEIMAEVVSHATAELLDYETVIDIDSKLRKFSVDNIATDNSTRSFLDGVLAINKAVVQIHLHRAFSMRAIVEEPLNPLKSRYATSFFASYRASSYYLHCVRQMFNSFPALWARFYFKWTTALSAAVFFGTIVAKAPRTLMAISAMDELEKAYVFFEEGSKYSKIPENALPALSRLREKALYALSIVESMTKIDDNNVPKHYDGKEDEDFAFLAGGPRPICRSLVTIERIMPLPATTILYLSSYSKRVRFYDLEPR